MDIVYHHQNTYARNISVLKNFLEHQNTFLSLSKKKGICEKTQHICIVSNYKMQKKRGMQEDTGSTSDFICALDMGGMRKVRRMENVELLWNGEIG